MRNNILIVGGYGKVGSNITTHLAQHYPKKTIIAGRSFKKALLLSEILDHNAIPYYLDISGTIDTSVLDGIKLVIMCIDQHDTKFVEMCIQFGVHYIDITANQFFIEQVEHLNEKAIANNVSILLSVGLAPGITNLLAQHCTNQLAKISYIEIFILLGLGEKHGDAAYRWTLDNIHTSYSVFNRERSIKIDSFSLPKQENLLGRRTFYSFNFSDQHILQKSLHAEQVLTRMAFDSRIFTCCVAICRRLKLSRFFKIKKVQDILMYLFKKLHIGQDVYAVKAVANDQHNEIYECMLTGNGEGSTTAYVAVEIAITMMQQNVTVGVNHLHQIVQNIPSFLDKISQYDKSIQINYNNKDGN